MRVIFHPEAREEMIESARFYESRVIGLGFDFLDAVNETTHQIERFPNAGQIERGSIRQRFVIGFPFKILYRCEQDHIFVGAVMHMRRKPGYWRTRMK